MRSIKIGISLLSIISIAGCQASTAEVLLPAPSLSACAFASSLIWNSQFESENWPQQWEIQPRQGWGSHNRQVLRQQPGVFPTFLRVYYPAGSASPRSHLDYGTPIGGTQFLATLNQPPNDALCLGYWVRFSDNFQFVKGGKLPGLYGGSSISGQKIPDGTNGFSTRLMWRRNGDGEVYAYLPTSTQDGTSIGRGSWKFQPGRWYHIEQQVLLNRPNQANGILRMWINQQLVLVQPDLLFRTTSALKIEGIFFSTFFGGQDLTWATPENVYADFAGFQLYAIDPRFATPGESSE
jgi:hypothetical protein